MSDSRESDELAALGTGMEAFEALMEGVDQLDDAGLIDLIETRTKSMLWNERLKKSYKDDHDAQAAALAQQRQEIEALRAQVASLNLESVDRGQDAFEAQEECAALKRERDEWRDSFRLSSRDWRQAAAERDALQEQVGKLEGLLGAPGNSTMESVKRIYDDNAALRARCETLKEAILDATTRLFASSPESPEDVAYSLRDALQGEGDGNG